MLAMVMGWIVVGLVAGISAWLARRRTRAAGPVTPMLVGIAGALLGGYLGLAMFGVDMRSTGYWLSAVVGSAALLVAYHSVLAARR